MAFGDWLGFWAARYLVELLVAVGVVVVVGLLFGLARLMDLVEARRRGARSGGGRRDG